MSRVGLTFLTLFLLSFCLQCQSNGDSGDEDDKETLKNNKDKDKKKPLQNGQLSKKDKKEILKAHNYYRKEEKAANMNKLRWDDTLEEMAQLWSHECKYQHGQPKSPESPYMSTGQNIYMRAPYALPNFTHVTFKWFEEKANYTFENQTCKPKAICGHYTQVVWADSTHLGCWVNNCTTLPPLKDKNSTIVVCNYGPGGNYPGTDPYEQGDPCDMCPDGTCEDGLCNDEDDD